MTAAALVAEVRARGVEVIPTPEGNLRVRPLSRIPPALLSALRERKAEVLALLSNPPGSGGAARQRVAAFARQLDDWTRTGRVGVPFLTLPDVEPFEGACLSCGDVTAQGHAWRCAPCEQAMAEVLGIPAAVSCGRCGALGSPAWLTTTDKGRRCPTCTLREHGPHA